MKHIIATARINKPIGTLLLLWPALMALFIATQGKPSWYLVVVFVIGAFLVRSAGCCINDFFDRNIDKHVERTAARPITSGKLKPLHALYAAAILLLPALAIALSFNKLSWLLCAITFALTCIYPLSKRLWNLPQLILGFTFNMGVLIAYSAATNALPLSAWILYAANLLFTLAYDTQYAVVDKPFDEQLNIGSTALLFGDASKYWIIVFDIVALILLVLVGKLNALAWPFYAGVVIAAIYIIKQAIQMQTISRQQFLQLFKQHQIILFWLMLGTIISYYV